MALKKINLEISDLTGGLLRDAGMQLQSERPAVLLSNEALQKSNEELEAQLENAEKCNAELAAQLEYAKKCNAELAAQLEYAKKCNAELAAQITAQQNLQDEIAPQLAELQAALQAKEAEVQQLRQRLEARQADRRPAQNDSELRKQLEGKNAEIRKLRQELSATRAEKKRPAAAPARNIAAPVSRNLPTRSRGTDPWRWYAMPDSRLCFPVTRLLCLYKLFGEMGMPHTQFYSFSHLAENAHGFDRRQLRALTMLVRERRKCQEADDLTDTFLDECIRAVRELSPQQLMKCSNLKRIAK